MREASPTPAELRANFEWCVAEALNGDYPPTETGLDPDTIYALRAVANAAAGDQPTDDLVAKARAAFAAPQ